MSALRHCLTFFYESHFSIKIWARRKERYFFGHLFFSFFLGSGHGGLNYWLARFAGCASDQVGTVGCPDSGGEGKTWLCDAVFHFFSKLSIFDLFMRVAVGAGVQLLLNSRSRLRCDDVCMYVYSCDFFFLFFFSVYFFFSLPFLLSF